MTTPKPNSSQDRFNAYVDLLRLDQVKYDELLRLRNKTTDQADDSKTRSAKRLRLVGPLWIGAEVRTPNGDVSLFRVYPIDLSSGGVAIFAGLFVHKDTPVNLKIRTIGGDWVTVQGHCVRCAFISGRVHEVGIKFEEPFDMSLVQAVDPKAALGRPAEESAAATPAAAPAVASPLGMVPDIQQQSQALAAASIELKSIAKELLDVIEKANERLQKVTEAANAIATQHQALTAANNSANAG